MCQAPMNVEREISDLQNNVIKILGEITTLYQRIIKIQESQHETLAIIKDLIEQVENVNAKTNARS